MIAALIAASALAYPSPPPLPVDSVAAEFKSECISPAGIAIGVRNWTAQMEFNAASRDREIVVRNELENARKADPFDIDRYATALKAYNDDQYYRLSKWHEFEISLLRELSPADRARWVKRLVRQYTAPPNYCGTK